MPKYKDGRLPTCTIGNLALTRGFCLGPHEMIDDKLGAYPCR
jgi:hypothetical protein